MRFAPTLAAAVCGALWLGLWPDAARAEDPARLAQAMKAVSVHDWTAAGMAARDSGPLASDVVEWNRLRAGDGAFAEYEDFLSRRSDWPGLPYLREKGEAALTGAEAEGRVVAYFEGEPPRTGQGALALVAARLARGDATAARAEAVRAWRALPLSEQEQATFVERYGTWLADHHGGRIAAMLAAGETTQARRMLPLVSSGTRAVAEARIALQQDAPGVDTLIAAVPERLAGSAGLAYDRFRWRIRKDRYDEAADLLIERSSSAEALGEPEAWAEWRRTLARREMRVGDPRRAYRMAANHFLTAGEDYADLEWLAGYIALRKLDDPGTALKHFQRFRVAVASPISLGRAGYWEGRAHEALGRIEDARAAYAFGAEYQTSFYGQLAAEKAGLPTDPALAGTEVYPDWRKAAFTGSSVFKAAMLLHEAGERGLSERFFLHLGESLDASGLKQLAAMAIDLNDAHLALLVAKAAAERGIIFPRAYFPFGGLHRETLPVPAELALAIARRESEFDPAVISPAGARGLMQVMPGTARLMAKKTGAPYEAGRLTEDWRYNAGLGAAYLAQLSDEFGALPLITAGYNAGPGRPRGWIKELGDPRSANVDPVDWIEHIPFTETRNYVMRVMEAVTVYRSRVAGHAVPIRIWEDLRGR